MSISIETVWQELKDAAFATINGGECSSRNLVQFLKAIHHTSSAAAHLREKALALFNEWLHQTDGEYEELK